MKNNRVRDPVGLMVLGCLGDFVVLHCLFGCVTNVLFRFSFSFRRPTRISGREIDVMALCVAWGMSQRAPLPLPPPPPSPRALVRAPCAVCGVG